jgi:hypothetical protein
MKKTLLLCIITSSSLCSFADVNLYGRVAVGLENDDFQNSTQTGSGSIQDFGSYFGLRGNDPVYGLTSAIWQIETLIDVTSGVPYNVASSGGMIVQPPGATGTSGFYRFSLNSLASSDSFLGLQGGWGRIRLGNLSNYIRSNMGAVDTFNYNNGVDGLPLWSRTPRILSTAMRYDSPNWGGFSFSGMYSYGSNSTWVGSAIANPANSGNGSAFAGLYTGGIWSGGVSWTGNGFGVKLGTQINDKVGEYNTGAGTAAPYPNAAYSNAYVNRLELSYEDPDGVIIGLGYQITNGWGWGGWANSGGSYNNVIYNSGFNVAGLTSNQYQSQEAAVALGWHLGPWTPKVAYAYGNNLMYGGDMWGIITGSNNQMANTGYHQVALELDWNITPKTIVFVNYGQVWYGQTLSNVAWCGANCGNTTTPVTGTNAAFSDQSTEAIGFTHTF